jgi:hypothetical protein
MRHAIAACQPSGPAGNLIQTLFIVVRCGTVAKWGAAMNKLIALMQRRFARPIEEKLTVAERRKSAIERKLRDLALEAFCGKTNAVLKFAWLEQDLKDISAQIDQLRAARDRELSAIGGFQSGPAPASRWALRLPM